MAYSTFFVSGVPKSGTTWLGKLLDSHPEISCKGEACMHVFIESLLRISRDYNNILKGRSGKFSESNEFPLLPEDEIFEIARYFVELRLKMISQSLKPDLGFVGEKDPYHVVNYPVLNRMFPSAKIIHIIRDGRGVVLSAWHHNLQISAQGVQAAGFDKFLDEAASQWGAMHRIARETSHLLGGRYLEIHYEDMIADPLTQFKKVLDHLGANSDVDVVRACLEAASFEKLSKGRSQGQEDPKSFFRKGIADDWKTQMTSAQIQRFNARSGGMLEELGYLS